MTRRDRLDDPFLAEVARLLPDADIVQLPAERPGQTNAPDPLTEVEQAEALVIESLAGAWRRLLPDHAEPTELLLGWSAALSGPGLGAQASCRLPDASFDPKAVRERLADHGWRWQGGSQQAADAHVRARRDGLTLDLVTRAVEHVVAMRVSTSPIEVGDLRGELINRGTRRSPWPAPSR